MILSFALLFFKPLSPTFYALYLVAGISDMIDGVVARKTHAESEFGQRLDTIADFIFVVICMIKLLSVLDIPSGIYLWIVGIAIVKLINIIMGYIRQKKFIEVHSIMNKVTGGVLFVFPMTLAFIGLKYSAMVVCGVATVAAIQEGYFVLQKN